MTTRRTFVHGAMLGGVATVCAGASSGLAHDGLATLRTALRLGHRLRRGELSQAQWREDIVAVLSGCSVATLSQAIELARLRLHRPAVDRGGAMFRIPQVGAAQHDKGPASTAHGADVRVMFLDKGRADPPHCHFNMVTAHLVLSGRVRVRHFGRVREEAAGVVLRATGDRVVGPGVVTTITDEHNNAHWHYAESDAILLNVQQGRLDPTLPIRRRQMLDPVGAQSLADGTLLAPRLSTAEALLKYG